MTDVETQLNEIEQRLIQAWLGQDWNTVDELLDEDWTVTDPRGRVLTKAQVIEEATTGQRTIDSGTIDEVKVRSFGDFGVVTGRTIASGSYQGNSLSVRLRFTDVFIKRGDSWKAVASQATLVTE